MTTPIRVAPCCLNDKIKFPAVYGVPKGHGLLPSKEKDEVNPFGYGEMCEVGKI